MKNSTVLHCSYHSLENLDLLNYASAVLKRGEQKLVQITRAHGSDYVAHIFVFHFSITIGQLC